MAWPDSLINDSSSPILGVDASPPAGMGIDGIDAAAEATLDAPVVSAVDALAAAGAGTGVAADGGDSPLSTITISRAVGRWAASGARLRYSNSWTWAF